MFCPQNDWVGGSQTKFLRNHALSGQVKYNSDALHGEHEERYNPCEGGVKETTAPMRVVLALNVGSPDQK
jgi:hypothetical protein